MNDFDYLDNLEWDDKVNENLVFNTDVKSFDDMSEEEKEEFISSEDYQEYKIDINNTNTGVNMEGKTVQEILGLSEKGDMPFYSFNSFEHYNIDIDDYEDILDNSPIVQYTVAEGEQYLPTFKYLHQDFYLSLVKYKPVILPENKIHHSVRLNRKILANMINTPEYIELRKLCRLDEFNAMLGSQILAEKIIKELKKSVEKVKDYRNKVQSLERLIQQEEEIDYLIEDDEILEERLQEIIDAMKATYMIKAESMYTPDSIMNEINNGVLDTGDMLVQEFLEAYQLKQDNELSIEEMHKVADALAQDCDELINNDELLNDIEICIGTYMNEASQEVNEVRNICSAWGLGEGSTCKVMYANKVNAVNKIRNSSKLLSFTDPIGRMKESAITEQKKKAKYGAVEIKSVTVGDKIQDTLPSERINMVNPITKGDFMRRMTEHSLLSYSKDSHKEKNKGPIIVCVDTSGSMHEDKEMWSKALTIAFLEVAQMQKRDFACIIYSSTADKPIVIKKDEISPQKIIDIAEIFHSGGTSFEAPLNEALELINDSTFKNADIVFITDGESSISQEFKRKFNKIKEDKEFRCIGILINLGSSAVTDNSLKDFCDEITSVSDIADMNNAESEINKSLFNIL